MKHFIVFLFIILSFFIKNADAQTTSQPGRIGKWAQTKKQMLQSSHLQCRIQIQEPSGDLVLGKGEKANIHFTIKNAHDQKSIQPQLIIETQASWEKAPRIEKHKLSILASSEETTFDLSLEWDKQYPSGTMLYRAQVKDQISGIESEWSTASVSIAGVIEEQSNSYFVDVDQNIPSLSVQNSNGIAVVIGNQVYNNPDVPNVKYAVQDARTMRQYLIQILGFHEENVFLLENATKSQLDLFFGNSSYYKGKLFNHIKPNRSDVFVYFSGHGAPDVDNKQAYLMPVDVDPNYIAINGYPLQVFYKNLEKLPAKSITVAMDACFSGGSEEGMLIKNASPVFIKTDQLTTSSHLNILASSTGNQISSWYPEGNHSLFTYYLLRGIRGDADLDRNRKINYDELRQFLEENVSYMARRLYGREQTPVINGNPKKIFNIY